MFNRSEEKEIQLCRYYVKNCNHYTPDHLRMKLVAKLADELEQKAKELESKPGVDGLIGEIRKAVSKELRMRLSAPAGLTLRMNYFLGLGDRVEVVVPYDHRFVSRLNEEHIKRGIREVVPGATIHFSVQV